MTSRGVSIHSPLLPVNARRYGFLRGFGMFFATLDSQDTPEPRRPLEVFFTGERSRSFRRCLHHRLNRVVDVADSNGSGIGKPIFVAQEENNRSIEIQWGFDFHIAALLEQIYQEGAKLKVIIRYEISSVFRILKKDALADHKDWRLYSTWNALMVLAERSSLTSTLTYAHVVPHV